MFSEIAEIKSIREQKSKLSEREAELTAPILTDLNMIGTLYEWYKELLSDQVCPGRVESANQRKKFIFIVLFLFAPSVLAGGRMPNGLRDKIAEAINLKDITFISHNIETIVFLHQNDKYFRKDIEWMYIEIMKRIKIKGLINEKAGV